MILEKINKPNDIKKLSPIEYNQLADEIRQFLIDKISVTGGHLAYLFSKVVVLYW